jgi:soluble lytic murein transglycosylase-like protein
MNIDYRKAFLAIIAAVIIAIPTAMVFQNHNNQIQGAQNKANHFQIDVQKKDSELKKLQIQTIEQKKADDAEKLKLQQENEQLKKDLQAKRDKQASDAKLAAASAASGVSGNCESYRPLVAKYFGDATPAAMITMSHESGCNPNAVSPTNDHGLFQLNNQPVYDPEANIRIAYAKFVSPRRGSTPNWSAWYAVCTPNLVPKYAGIWCS